MPSDGWPGKMAWSAGLPRGFFSSGRPADGFPSWSMRVEDAGCPEIPLLGAPPQPHSHLQTCWALDRTPWHDVADGSGSRCLFSPPIAHQSLSPSTQGGDTGQVWQANQRTTSAGARPRRGGSGSGHSRISGPKERHPTDANDWGRWGQRRLTPLACGSAGRSDASRAWRSLLGPERLHGLGRRHVQRPVRQVGEQRGTVIAREVCPARLWSSTPSIPAELVAAAVM